MGVLVVLTKDWATRPSWRCVPPAPHPYHMDISNNQSHHINQPQIYMTFDEHWSASNYSNMMVKAGKTNNDKHTVYFYTSVDEESPSGMANTAAKWITV